jgi:hypothetical protein
MLWRIVLSLAVYLQPPSMRVFVSGECHFVHMRDGLCFHLHLWICTPHATSSESLLARKGGVEYACIVLSADLEVLTWCRIWLYMVPCLIVVLDVCDRMSLRRLQCRSAILVKFGGVSLLVFRFGARFEVPLWVGLHQ